jgi:uncharacterized protein (DUF302 family)
MPVRNVEIERVSIISSKPFEAVIGTLSDAIGHPDMVQFKKETGEARTFVELENIVKKSLGRTELMLFLELDQGNIIQKEKGTTTPKMIRFLIGNPLIMKEMAKHVPDVGSYAPVTILADERPDGVRLTYDRTASLIASYGSPEALAVAKELDSKVETLLCERAS